MTIGQLAGPKKRMPVMVPAVEAWNLTPSSTAPAAVGVPEMTPVVVFTASPAGKPAALKLLGLLLAVYGLVITGANCSSPMVSASAAEPARELEGTSSSL